MHIDIWPYEPHELPVGKVVGILEVIIYLDCSIYKLENTLLLDEVLDWRDQLVRYLSYGLFKIGYDVLLFILDYPFDVIFVDEAVHIVLSNIHHRCLLYICMWPPIKFERETLKSIKSTLEIILRRLQHSRLPHPDALRWPQL